MWKAKPPTIAERITPSSRQPQHPAAIQNSGPLPFLGGGASAAGVGGMETRAGRDPGAGRGGGPTRPGMEPGGSEPVGGTAAARAGGGGGGGGAAARGAAGATGGAGGRDGGRAGFTGCTTVASGASVNIVASMTSSPSISTLKLTAPKRSSWPERSVVSAIRWLSTKVPLALP